MKYYSDEALQAELPRQTLYGYVYDNNKNNMDDIAFCYFGRKISYRDFFENVKRTAEAFAAFGIKKGDFVTILSLVTPETIFCIYALNYIGAVANMGSLSLTGNEIVETVRNTHSRITIVMDVAAQKVLNVHNELSSELTIVLNTETSMSWTARLFVGFKKKNIFPSIKNLLSYAAFVKKYTSSGNLEPCRYEKDMPAVIVYTSGTTAKPKGVVLTNDSINAVAFQYRYSGMKFKRGETILTFIPPFFAFGFSLDIHMPLTLGVKEILSPNPKPTDVVDKYRKYKPNHFVAAPSNIVRLIEEMKDNSMKFCVTLAGGGESLTPRQEKMINTYLEEHECKAKYISGYGMTEFAATVTTGLNNVYKEGTLGIPLCRTIVKIVDTETLEELPYNEVGEMCFHTPSQMKEYFCNSTETAKTIRKHKDGLDWIHTGDLGFVDEDGFVHFKGRIKRIYMTAMADGSLTKVFPARTEEVLSEVSGVEKCAVSVILEDNLVKEQVAYLVLSDDVAGEECIKAVQRHCKEKLPAYYAPDRYVVLDELPLTQSGKTDYMRLENWDGRA